MKILTLPRAGGKTRTLSQLMIDNTGLVYVAPDHRMAHNAYMAVAKTVPDIDRSRFIPAHDAAQFMRERKIQGRAPELLVDELDYVLQSLLGGTVYLATRSA